MCLSVWIVINADDNDGKDDDNDSVEDDEDKLKITDDNDNVYDDDDDNVNDNDDECIRDLYLPIAKPLLIVVCIANGRQVAPLTGKCI